MALYDPALVDLWLISVFLSSESGQAAQKIAQARLPGSRMLESRSGVENIEEGRQSPPEVVPGLISTAVSTASDWT